LSRNLAFIAALMESGVEFVAVDNPHMNKLTIHILAAVAEHEREMISERTKAALQAAKARGRVLGTPGGTADRCRMPARLLVFADVRILCRNRTTMTLGSHQTTIGRSQNWITPKWILDALGRFDLDPAAAYPRPWDCAATSYTRDGLELPWFGRVWLNPPFDRYAVGKWVQRLADHGRGICLLHCRTEAEWFEPVWRSASGILFLADRIYFHYPDGRRAEANSGAPACLISFGAKDLAALHASGIAGYFVTAWTQSR
jgi:Resolvase, N terminal domain/DNA N-6-adenine-methyltransferase (Dam)